MTDEMDSITRTICAFGKISGIGPDDDFYDAGFSSINALELLLTLETDHGVCIPDDEFIAARTPQALVDLIGRLNQEQMT